jgi:preprotein translocase subunit SecG
MENVVLTVHLILALCLVGVVLMQRSEGGGLGMGGGGPTVTGRAPTTALGKLTWILAIAFIITSITLTLLAAGGAGPRSVIDQIGGETPAEPAPLPLPDPGALLPPVVPTAPAAPPAPLVPPRAD